MPLSGALLLGSVISAPRADAQLLAFGHLDRDAAVLTVVLLVAGIVTEQVLSLQFGGDLREDLVQFLELVGQESHASGLAGQFHHPFVTTGADLVQANGRSAGIDAVEETVVLLQFAERIAETKTIAVGVFTV